MMREVYVPSASLAIVDSGSRIVVLNLSGRREPVPLALEGPALEIWRALCAGRTGHEVAEELALRHGLSAREIEADVKAFLENVVEQGLLD